MKNLHTFDQFINEAYTYREPILKGNFLINDDKENYTPESTPLLKSSDKKTIQKLIDSVSKKKLKAGFQLYSEDDKYIISTHHGPQRHFLKKCLQEISAKEIKESDAWSWEFTLK